jgi:hypothetical protein
MILSSLVMTAGRVNGHHFIDDFIASPIVEKKSLRPTFNDYPEKFFECVWGDSWRGENFLPKKNSARRRGGQESRKFCPIILQKDFVLFFSGGIFFSSPHKIKKVRQGDI